MKRNPIKLDKPERFSTVPEIAPEKIDRAIEQAADRLEAMLQRNGMLFPACGATDYKYTDYGINRNWVGGMYVGCFWLAYQMTRRRAFRKPAFNLTDTFEERLNNKVGIDDHDVGFAFTPSCVAAYRLSGVQKYKKIALDAAKYFYEHSYSKEGKFIIRGWNWKREFGYRTMMDALMNAPLLYWAAKMTGNEDYFRAAHDHVKTTEELLVRADGSSYHHYQFNRETHEPMYGVTAQGHRDESTWSRGHAWGVYGFPIAYNYDKSDFIKEVHRDVTYFFLNHLPEDMVPYWDFDFVDGDEPRDSSAGAVAVCGLLEMARMLDDSDPDKTVFRSAAAQIMESLIDNYTDLPEGADGLINHVTAALPQNMGIDQTAVYGDYFYLEALARYKNPDFKMHW